MSLPTDGSAVLFDGGDDKVMSVDDSATTLRGQAELISYEVSTFVDGDLPADDHSAVMALA